MKITIGRPESMGVGIPAVVHAPDGAPITIEGLGLELTYADGVLEIRGTHPLSPGGVRPVVRASAANVVTVVAEGLRVNYAPMGD
jgi:hypothetical protein